MLIEKLDYLFVKDKSVNLLLLTILFIPISLIAGNAVTNINLVIISIVFLFSLTKNKTLQVLYSKNNLIILFFFLLIILTDLLALNHFNLKSIYLIKFYLFFVSIGYVFKKNHNSFLIISIFTFIILLFFSLDVIYQYIFGTNLIGISSNSNTRFSGMMGTEWIAGSYISKLLIIALSFLFILRVKKKINIALILFFFFTVIISGERMALFNYIFLCLLLSVYFFYTKYFSFKDLTIFTTSLIIIFVIFYKLLPDEHKTNYTLDVLLKLKLADHISKIYNFNEKNENIISEELDKNNTHVDIFISSYKIIKKNFLFGTGTNNFFSSCDTFKYEKIYCESHSHNLYLNILSENGILVLIFFIYLLYVNIYKKLIFNSKINPKALNFLTVIVFLNPISVSGDLFSTWTGTIFWYIFGIYSSLDKSEKQKN